MKEEDEGEEHEMIRRIWGEGRWKTKRRRKKRKEMKGFRGKKELKAEV